ncbi:hypothetical protein GZH49_12140 [Nocardia terpenica]|uniref:hypothetical protein n=1 Tax=Nocardia terpenica TaxID=455432 RepID=UPI002FE2BBC3
MTTLTETPDNTTLLANPLGRGWAAADAPARVRRTAELAHAAIATTVARRSSAIRYVEFHWDCDGGLGVGGFHDAAGAEVTAAGLADELVGWTADLRPFYRAVLAYSVYRRCGFWFDIAPWQATPSSKDPGPGSSR